MGGFFLSYNYIQSKKIVAFDYMANMFYNGTEIVEATKEGKENIQETEKQQSPVEQNETKKEEQQETQKETKKEEQQEVQKETPKETPSEEVTNEYIGYLMIPKINLTKGFLDIRSPENDVEKNILVVDGSDYPDKEKGNLIIAGHSGTGWKAFFNDLYQLQVNDKAYITYKGKKYTYNIVNIYKQPKTGKIAIYRNYEKTTLTLITCTNNESTSQTVYIAELINIE